MITLRNCRFISSDVG